MSKLFPPEIIENSTQQHFVDYHTKSKIIYIIVIVVILIAFAVLPLINIDITTQNRGYIRSEYENNRLQIVVNGEIERIQRINNHIYNETSGRPDEFAKRMGVSKRQLYNIIEVLKDFDAPIRYDRNRETFFYDGDFNLDIQFSMRILTDQEDKSIFGGYFSKNLLPCNFISRNPSSFSPYNMSA